MQQAEPLVRQYGDDEKANALSAIESIKQLASDGQAAFNHSIADSDSDPGARPRRLAVGLKSPAAGKEKKQAQGIARQLRRSVEYAPMWVRLLSAICLGVGTMFGYKRMVKTLGERLGNVHLTPAQGASTEVVAALLIGTAGFTGLPVSTTHIVASGIAGTLVKLGAGLRYGMVSHMAMAWIFTLPVTILIAGGLYYLLAGPRF